jgi:hypothetical protein
MNDQTRIAGLKTVAHWRTKRSQLMATPTNNDWEEAFNDFLFTRISSRYFEPIEAVSQNISNYGRGFAIVAIYSSLIEFFETLKKGHEFRHPHYFDRNNQLVRSSTNIDAAGVHQPLAVKEVFVNFLTQNSPFNTIFNPTLADSFYMNVRCAILHEAETHGNWLIREGKVIEDVVFVDSVCTPPEFHLKWIPLKNSFQSYLNHIYRNQLLSDQEIQANFIFKFDNICEI